LTGRYLPLTPQRRWIADLLHFAKKVPTVPVERRMALAPLRPLRRQAAVSWPALFLKAFGLASQEYPPLRRAWISCPCARLYEHPHSVASVAIERKFADEPAVFFAQIRAPENQKLTEIDAALARFKHAPLESIGAYRRAIRFSQLPRWLRRLAWSLSLNWSGPKRAKRMGTFGLSVYAGLGSASLHPLSPISFVINYGVLDDQGNLDVRIIYDHRVVDGAVVARALAAMEAILLGPITDELLANVQSRPALAKSA
jgi:hypothetical protein